jgi:hypothetical protein
MALNPYLRSSGNDNFREASLYEDLVIESIQAYGQDVVYIPRKLLKYENILNEEVISAFNDNFTVEMYLESVEGFEGDGKLLERFGLEVRDEAVFVVAKKRWNELIAQHNYDRDSVGPRAGDLIWLGMSKSLFEIRYVDTKKPFYQLGEVPTYALTCELFEYTSEDIDTGIKEIDDIQSTSGGTTTFIVETSPGFIEGETVTFVTPNNETGSAEFFDEELDELVDPPEINIILSPLTFNDNKEVKLPAGTVFTGMQSGTSTVVVQQLNQDDSDEANFGNVTNSQNHVFSKENIKDFVDFSETNPFGDPFTTF